MIRVRECPGPVSALILVVWVAPRTSMVVCKGRERWYGFAEDPNVFSD